MKLLKITKKAWIVFILAFALTFMMGAKVEAQEETAQKYGVTFPVEELGSCASLAECKTYCDDPVNQAQCVDFAKKKGFYKEPRKNAIQNSIAISAAQELGCDSQVACKQFCSLEENRDKCQEFAKKYKLEGEKAQKIASQDTLTKAKEALGCQSVESCKSLCQKEENREKCQEFAKAAGLKGGVEKKGPGGCATQESCSTYCSDPNNFEECSKFGAPNKESFKGPGGCNSPESCKAFCGENPQKCTQLKTSTEFKGSPAQPAFLNADDKAKFCREFPEKCNTAPSGGTLSKPPVNIDYAKKCVESGCSWTGSSCNCSSRTPYPAQSFSPKPTYAPPPAISPEEYCKSKGCSFSNNSCQCPTSGATSFSPKPQPTTTVTSSPLTTNTP